MIFKQLNAGPCHTYLIASEESREAALVDPVLDRVEEYLKVLDQEKLRLAFIVDTHTHADHISGGPALCDHTGSPYVMHRVARPQCPTYRVEDGETISVGEITIRFLHTPGHTNDSVTLVLDDRLLTGDFLFIGEAGAGRTDLPTGDPGEHFDSLQKLIPFADEMLVFPAHDYRGQTHSTLGQERRTNPRLRVRSREEYVGWLTAAACAPPEWMKDVVRANYACTRDPRAVWIPADLPVCEVALPLTLGEDAQAVRTITAEEAKGMLDREGNRILVLDVRNPDEYVGELGHIPGSLLIPVHELPKRLAEIEPYRSRVILTICRSGGRSRTASRILQQGGFTHVYNVAGGMLRWNELDYPRTSQPPSETQRE
jgi:glyoxylase-like metal-dependent hydrolase (beta-lactamase superfamily II)/rhodanese-related sulfurtransferase